MSFVVFQQVCGVSECTTKYHLICHLIMDNYGIELIPLMFKSIKMSAKGFPYIYTYIYMYVYIYIYI